MAVRVIPILLLRGRGFYKTRRFSDPTYLGDPVNILKIFNDKEADEIAVLDISATPENRGPDFEQLTDLASECFMPLAYGGGVREVAQVRRLIKTGFEKVILNTGAIDRPALVREASAAIGSQSVVVCIDVKKRLLGGYEVVTSGGRRHTGMTPVEWASEAENLGAGELILNAVDRDGAMVGYDLPLIEKVTSAVRIPVVASGGARSVDDFRLAVRESGASACAAGAMFVFQGRHRAVLINMPTRSEIDTAIG